MARPSTYKSEEEFEDKMEEYKEYCEEKAEPFTMIGLASFMGVHRDTLNEYGKKFPDTYKKGKSFAEKSLVNNALAGTYNPTISIFLLKNNHGYKDKHETEISGELNVNSMAQRLMGNK